MFSKYTRGAVVLVTTGFIWYYSFMLYFVWSGAQQILANPQQQSAKFLKVFFEIQPLPRMVQDSWLIIKGLYIIGILSALVFFFLNNKLSGNWLRKGVVFGGIQWLLMIPWFEFYLPYNVMNEPLLLVLLEGLLWLLTIITVYGITSFIYNFKAAKR